MDKNFFVGDSKTFLHLATEQNHKQILSYLLFDAKCDPNLLTRDSRMSALHIAIKLYQYEVMEILLANETATDVNVMAELGTPLHLAAKLDLPKAV